MTATVSPGIAAHEMMLELCRLNNVPFTLNKWQDAEFANGVTFTYDPADYGNDPTCPTEWLYVKRHGRQLCEGGVTLCPLDPMKCVYRVDIESPELILPNAGTLVGLMFVKVLDGIIGRV